MQFFSKKYQLLLVGLLLAFFGWCKPTEEQRKYSADQPESFQTFLTDTINLNGFFKTGFEMNLYKDLYLDTPDFLLFEKGYSLRLRKRFLGAEGTVSYGFQLKNEMMKLGDVRMEVEEAQLDFYTILYDGIWVKLTAVLDVLFEGDEKQNIDDYGDNTGVFSKAIHAIQNWITLKAGAPIAPFQKLQFLEPSLFTIREIQTLRPVLIGEIKRNRFSIYINPELSSFYDFAQNPIPKGDLPAFFRENPQYIWTMQGSVDHATFYPLFKKAINPVQINELEIENKYKGLIVGHELMDKFEAVLTHNFGFHPTLNSKYRESILKWKN